MVSRAQLLGLGFNRNVIEHRLANGRLHRMVPGVYAVGSPHVSRYGHWMAAVLACGPEAALSHDSAAALLGIRPDRRGRIEVSVPVRTRPRPPGILVHRRRGFSSSDVTRHHNISVTAPVLTLIDLATRLSRDSLEAAINETDKLKLIDPEALRAALTEYSGQPGVGILRETLDRRTFTLTHTQLERRFLPIVRQTGLPKPATQRWLNGFRVDFYWPDLGLVVETDGLSYHRTPAEQARDRVRDQTHTAAGLTCLRFTRAQVMYEPARVQAVLSAVARRLNRA